MRFHYDRNNDALYIRFNENPYAESDEVRDGIVFDYDRRKKIIGIEILDVSKNLPKEFQAHPLKKKLLIHAKHTRKSRASA